MYSLDEFTKDVYALVIIFVLISFLTYLLK